MTQRDFILSTETTCDMDPQFYEKNQVHLLGLTFSLNNEDHPSVGDNLMAPSEFYARVRAGEMPQTAQVSVGVATTAFEMLAAKGLDVIHLSFSSTLSGTCHSCSLAAQEVMARYPECRIVVIDSLSASMGQGLLLHHLVGQKRAGRSMDECIDFVNQSIPHICHVFTVDDLNYLHKGGRVSKMTAVVGTALGIKPTLHIDPSGKLINVGKVRGRKQSLGWLVDQMESHMIREKCDTVFISHGDCKEDAEYVANLVSKRFHTQQIVIGYIGPVIGSHAGPGTVALFFIGDSREML